MFKPDSSLAQPTPNFKTKWTLEKTERYIDLQESSNFMVVNFVNIYLKYNIWMLGNLGKSYSIYFRK